MRQAGTQQTESGAPHSPHSRRCSGSEASRKVLVVHGGADEEHEEVEETITDIDENWD